MLPVVVCGCLRYGGDAVCCLMLVIRCVLFVVCCRCSGLLECVVVCCVLFVVCVWCLLMLAIAAVRCVIFVVVVCD